ncbi:MAG TPA: hypothetical protein VKS82_05230 [Streptosporangiaceae bacterium]|nr:hypothetical protein [Streptosporangiaceae bacterium]
MAASAGLLTVAGVFASAGPASADTTITIRYPVTGTTHLAAPNADLPLGPGKLTATADLNTDAITANLKLPDATGSFKELGLIPVTATAQLINDGPTTGTLDPNTGAVTTTSLITMRIVSLTVAGIPQLVGDSCETSSPVSVTVTSQPGFNIIKGGNLAGTYTIPPFANCGLDTLLINLTLPGQGNTITLTLGKGKVVH